MKLGYVAGAVGRGLVAGLVGTAAISLSQAIEMKLRDRKPSPAPAKAAEKVLGLRPVGDDQEKRFSMLVHWGYGTLWGGVRGLLSATGLEPWESDAAHFAALWGTELAMLPSLGLSSPITEWKTEEIAIDILHHAVYTIAAGKTYEFLDKHSQRPR